MNKKTLASGLVGLLAFGGAAAIAVPIASADDTTAAVAFEDRAQARAERLAELVEQGVISQEEADEIQARHEARAAERAERREERAAMLADLLGITTDELRAGFEAGQSVADMAVENGVSVDSVINELVIEANARLDEKVADGSIDAAKADEIRAGLVDRITARVNGERPEGERRGRPGPGGPGGPSTAPAGLGGSSVQGLGGSGFGTA